MESIEVDGLRIAYERAGSGPALVLLHGYVGDGPATWRPQLQGLQDAFTVVAWSAPGAGGSSDPPESFGMAGYADCLAAFIQALGLETPHVAGLSFGGALALELAHRHPAIPATLVLASAYAGWAGSLPPEATAQRLRQALVLADLSPEEFAGTLLPTMFSRSPAPEAVDALAASMRSFHPAGFRAMARASAEDLRPALPAIAVPTLLIYGDQDVRAPLPVANALHAAIPGSTLVVLPGIGHVCNLEAPEAFNRAVRAFLLAEGARAVAGRERVRGAATVSGGGRAVMETFRSTITPVLTVRHAAQAVAFYERAFGAEELYRTTYPDGRIVAELAVDGARFRVADEAPEVANLSPQALNGTTVRINLLVADPDRFAERAIANGAIEIAPIADQSYGLRQGRLADPFGHHWLIGRPLAGEPGDWARTPGPPRGQPS